MCEWGADGVELTEVYLFLSFVRTPKNQEAKTELRIPFFQHESPVCYKTLFTQPKGICYKKSWGSQNQWEIRKPASKLERNQEVQKMAESKHGHTSTCLVEVRDPRYFFPHTLFCSISQTLSKLRENRLLTAILPSNIQRIHTRIKTKPQSLSQPTGNNWASPSYLAVLILLPSPFFFLSVAFTVDPTYTHHMVPVPNSSFVQKDPALCPITNWLSSLKSQLTWQLLRDFS